MALLLVVILLLVIVFSVLPEILPGISRKLVDLTVEESKEEGQLRREITELKNDLRNINMVDEFAKYAKTERKINKLKVNLNEICKSKTEVFLKFKLGMNSVFHVVQLLTFLVLIYNYRSVPLLQLSPDWVSPLNWIVAFPTGIPGAVSVTFWTLTCRTTVPRVVQLFR